MINDWEDIREHCRIVDDLRYMHDSMLKCNNYTTIGGRGAGKSFIEELKRRTGVINEDVIGCYFSNYQDKYICGRFHNSGCRNLYCCNKLYEAEHNIRR